MTLYALINVECLHYDGAKGFVLTIFIHPNIKSDILSMKIISATAICFCASEDHRTVTDVPWYMELQVILTLQKKVVLLLKRDIDDLLI